MSSEADEGHRRPAAGPPPGWYPHPTMASTSRYWDGAQWTEHIAPAGQAAPTSEPDHSGLITAGFVTAILLPIVGFIIGVVLLGKGKGAQGAGVMLLSVLTVVLFATYVG